MTSEKLEAQLNRRYDVFLCFLETDCDRKSRSPNSFIRYFYDDMINIRFTKIFINEDEFERGYYNSIYLLKALEGSLISIVILTKNFAVSTFCLDELVHILDCKRTKNQFVLPIFFDVDVSEVRNQTGTYGDALNAHELRFGKDSKKLQKWKSALFEISNIKGFVHDYDGERMCYEYDRYKIEIVKMIMECVNDNLPTYHVFLSYMEKDTRYSFTGYLYNAFSNLRRFKTFIKEKGWDQDENQSSKPNLTAIENSSLSIIVLSDNYAYSSSCLDELVAILDIMKTKNRLVLPVFYKVEPSDVRHQRKSYADAMARHENKLGKDSEKVKTWRSALIEIASLKGWHLKSGYEYDLIEKIRDTIYKLI